MKTKESRAQPKIQVRNPFRVSCGHRPHTRMARFRVITDHGCAPVRNITNRGVLGGQHDHPFKNLKKWV